MVDEGARPAVRSGLLVAALSAQRVSTRSTSPRAGGRPRRRASRRSSHRRRARPAARPARRTRPRRRREGGAAGRGGRGTGEAVAGRGGGGAGRRRGTRRASLEARTLQLQAELDELSAGSSTWRAGCEEVDDELADAEDARARGAQALDERGPPGRVTPRRRHLPARRHGRSTSILARVTAVSGGWQHAPVDPRTVEGHPHLVVLGADPGPEVGVARRRPAPPARRRAPRRPAPARPRWTR